MEVRQGVRKGDPAPKRPLLLCTCEFCLRPDAAEVLRRTTHWPPNFTETHFAGHRIVMAANAAAATEAAEAGRVKLESERPKENWYFCVRNGVDFPCSGRDRNVFWPCMLL